MIEASLLVLGGFILLGIGGEALVRGAVDLAKQLKVPPLIIGLTLVAFGTSAPELMVSIQAALDGQPDIAIGNVVGSNIANILLVLGATALIRPILADMSAQGVQSAQSQAQSMWRDTMVMLSVTIGFVLIAQFGRINAALALAMLAILTLYVIYVYRFEKNKSRHESAENTTQNTTQNEADSDANSGSVKALLLLIIGIVAVVWGADILVAGAITIAQGFGVPEAVIGLSLIAIGTSLPELAISVLAAIRGHTSVAIGNILGSNISNILLILGITGLIEPLSIAPQIANFDVWIMLGASLIVVYFMAGGARVTRAQGGICLAAYVLYIAFLYAA